MIRQIGVHELGDGKGPILVVASPLAINRLAKAGLCEEGTLELRLEGRKETAVLGGGVEHPGQRTRARPWFGAGLGLSEGSKKARALAHR